MSHLLTQRLIGRSVKLGISSRPDARRRIVKPARYRPDDVTLPPQDPRLLATQDPRVLSPPVAVAASPLVTTVPTPPNLPVHTTDNYGQVAVSEAASAETVRALSGHLPADQQPDVISVASRTPPAYASSMTGAVASPAVALHTPVGVTTAGSGLGLVTPAIGAAGPALHTVVLGVPVPYVVGLLSAALGLGWGALALCAVVTRGSVVELLFPSAVHQSGAGFLAALWGASLVPLAAASITLKGVVDSHMTGTRGADQLNFAVLVGCTLTLMVTLQAVSLWHLPFNALVGGLAGVGLALTSWLATRAHPWQLPRLLNLTPRSLVSTAYILLNLGLVSTGIGMFLFSVPNAPAVLLGGVSTAESLAIFAGRACGGALVTSGLICGLLSAAADRLLLATSTAQLLSASVAASSLLISLVVALGMAVRVASPSRELFLLLVGQLAVGSWALTATFRPAGVQGASRLMVGGRHLQLQATRREPPVVGLNTQQFWQAMALPPEIF